MSTKDILCNFYQEHFELIEESNGTNHGIVKLIQDDHTVSTNRIVATGIDEDLLKIPHNLKTTIFYEGFNFTYTPTNNHDMRHIKKILQDLTEGKSTFINMLSADSLKRVSILATDKKGLCNKTIKYLEQKEYNTESLMELERINHKRECNHAVKLVERAKDYDVTYAFFGSHHFKSKIIQNYLKANSITYAIFKKKSNITIL